MFTFFVSTILSPHSASPAGPFFSNWQIRSGWAQKVHSYKFVFASLSLASYVVSFFQHDDNHVLFAVKSITKRALQLLRAYILTARGIPVMSAHLKQKKMFKAYRRPKRHLLHTYTQLDSAFVLTNYPPTLWLQRTKKIPSICKCCTYVISTSCHYTG